MSRFGLFSSWLLLVALSVTWLTPCGVAAAQSKPVSSNKSDSTVVASDNRRLVQIGPGDSVAIQVYGQPDMTGTVYVADDGTLPIPLAGAVQIAGLSPSEAAKKIETALRIGGYLLDPHVTLTVTQSLSQRVSVLGEVKAPGRYPITGNTSIYDVIAQAGGTSDNSASIIYVLRQNSNGETTRYAINLKGLANDSGAVPVQTLQGGDSIVVPRAEQFFISGEVRASGMYKIEPGMTVEEAIIRAGGITERGSNSRIDIKRNDVNGKPKQRSADTNELVKAGDVIHVKESIF